MIQRIIFTIILSISIWSLKSQTLCNASTITPTYYFYPGAAYDIGNTIPAASVFYLCNNAIVYDTSGIANRNVMIEAGAQYIWKPCGNALSKVWIKSGGTLIYKQFGCNTATDLYMESSAIIIDTYSVMASYTMTYSCSSIVLPIVNCSLGISENVERNSLIIYPNPSPEIVKITISDLVKEDALNIKIIDLLGKEVLAEDYKEELNISKLQKGIYFLALLRGNYMINSKIIIKE